VINTITTYVPIQPTEQVVGGIGVEVFTIERVQLVDYVVEPITNPQTSTNQEARVFFNFVEILEEISTYFE